MTCIQFPDNPTIGQEVVVGNVTYRCTATTPKPIWESVTAPLKLSQMTNDIGVSGTFTTSDGKTVTVTDGIITEIV